jgi:hypothetical protein
MSDPSLDLYLRFERELRTPRRRLLVDAFLPPVETIESAVPPPPPPPEPFAEPTRGVVQQLRGEDPVPVPEPRPRRRRRRDAAEPHRSLQQEIDEFMNRDGTALAPDVDPERDPEAGP